MNMEQSVETKLAGTTKVLGKKPTPVPLHSPQIPHNLTMVRSQQMTTWPGAWTLMYGHLVQFSRMNYYCIPLTLTK
jgi:hypothetical protein